MSLHILLCLTMYFFQYLADIEDHLNVTIQQVEPDIEIPANEFDGKVVYGQKRINTGIKNICFVCVSRMQCFV